MNAKKETKNKKKIPSSEKASEYFNLSKYKKRILTTIIIVLLLGTLAIGTWGLLKAKLLVDEDIIIKMNLTYSSLNLKHGESVNISIENEITTTFLCESQCSIILKKIDDNTIVYQSTEIVKETNKIIATFNISADKLGYGQELYSYQISCKNLYSNICPAPDTFVKKNALISLNYAPNELELEAKGQLEKNLAEIMTNLITTSSLINQNKEYVAQFKIQNKTEFYDKILQQEKSYHTYERFINSLNDDSVKDYLLTNKKIEAASILERTANLLNDTNNLNKILNEQAKAHNLALQLINNITKEKQLLDELSQTENINKFTNKTTNLNHYTYIENQTNKIIYKFNNNEIKNYAEIIQELQTITKTIQELKQDYIINFKTNYLQLLLTLNFIETDLCIANNQSEDCRNLTKLDNSLNIIQDNASLAQNIILNTNQCTLIKELSINDTITKETQVQKRENIPIPELEIIDQEKLFIDYSLLQFLTREINTRNLPLSTILQEYKEEIIKNINNSHNSNLSINSEYYPTQYNKSSANLIIPLTDDFENLLEQSKNLCETSYKIKLNFLNLHEQPIKIQTPIQAQASEFKIKNINPICCAYNFCYSCNTNMDLADTPLLLLHGHSFYTKHTPDYSTNIFSNMLTKLETDEKYIPGGLISSDKTPYS